MFPNLDPNLVDAFRHFLPHGIKKRAGDANANANAGEDDDDDDLPPLPSGTPEAVDRVLRGWLKEKGWKGWAGESGWYY